MRRACTWSLALAPALLVAPATAQFSSVTAHRVAAVGLGEPSGSQQSEPLQIRVLESMLDAHTRVEVDLAAEARMSLLVSANELMVAMMGIQPSLLQPHLVMSMSRSGPRTYAVDLPTAGLPAGTVLYLQAVAIAASGRLSASIVAPLHLCEPADPCGAIIPGSYSGSAQFSVGPMVAIGPPVPVWSWTIDVSVTVRSNDWDLTHQLTRQGPNGTEVFLILKEPGPGEGQLDVVETHTVTVELGQFNPGDITFYVAVTQLWSPPPSSLQFQLLAE